MRQITAHRKSIEASIVKLKKERDAIDAELAQLIAMLKATEPKKTRKVARKVRVRVKTKGRSTRDYALALLKRGETTAAMLAKKADITPAAAQQMLSTLMSEKVAMRSKRGVYVEAGN